MGTNYYWVTPPCDHCGRADDWLHIGKSQRTLRGHFTWDRDRDDWVPRITTWAEWVALLRAGGGRIVDECDVEHDVEDFIATWERYRLTPEGREQSERDLAECLRLGSRVAVEPGGDWLDLDGMHFYGGEFS